MPERCFLLGPLMDSNLPPQRIMLAGLVEAMGSEISCPFKVPLNIVLSSRKQRIELLFSWFRWFDRRSLNHGQPGRRKMCPRDKFSILISSRLARPRLAKVTRSSTIHHPTVLPTFHRTAIPSSSPLLQLPSRGSDNRFVALQTMPRNFLPPFVSSSRIITLQGKKIKLAGTFNVGLVLLGFG